MRKGFASISFLVTVIVLLFATSCIKDRCKDVVCKHMGICVDGVCSCTSGYEGAICDIEWSKKFVGDWHATENYFRSTESHQYELTINKTSNADSFSVFNLGDSIFILCKQDKINSFTFIPDQVIDSQLTLKSGNGVLDSTGTKVTGLYSFKLKDTTITTSFSWTK